MKNLAGVELLVYSSLTKASSLQAQKLAKSLTVHVYRGQGRGDEWKSGALSVARKLTGEARAHRALLFSILPWLVDGLSAGCEHRTLPPMNMEPSLEENGLPGPTCQAPC